MKFTRIYEKPRSSIFLLGPRATGKSTFIKQEAGPDLVIDLLKQSTYRQLSLNPSAIEDLIKHLKRGQSILIDEVQKLPELLDEVHRLIEDYGYIFYLTGSSARKLKKGGANLLAGRALSKKMFPLSLHEIKGERTIASLLASGCLPKAVSTAGISDINEFLFTYVETYLKEEIFLEGLTRNLKEFSQFIQLAGQYHGQILNYENLSREIGKSGDTIKSWFQILEDTLIGQRIDPYPLGLMAKETQHPRFYYFDCGVARAAEGIQDINEFPERRGYYFESIILNELKVYFEIRKKRYDIFYYSVSSYGDLDFIIETKKKSHSSPAKYVAIEVKYSKTWKTEFEKVINKIKEERPIQLVKAFGIYLGSQQLTKTNIDILPIDKFVSLLWEDKLF